jgi:hypothetical protein
LTLPILVLDDADALKDSAWEVRVRAYDAKLKQIKERCFTGQGSIKKVATLGDCVLTADETKTSPLMVVADVLRNGTLVQRNDYVTNFEAVKDCLFQLPRTKLAMNIVDRKVCVTNQGSVPAVSVHVIHKGPMDDFVTDHNYFWLEPGETSVCRVNEVESVQVSAWNVSDNQ